MDTFELEAWIILMIGTFVGLFTLRALRGRWGFVLLLLFLSRSAFGQGQPLGSVLISLHPSSSFMNPNNTMSSYATWYLPPNFITTGTPQPAQYPYNAPLVKFSGIGQLPYYIGYADYYLAGSVGPYVRRLGFLLMIEDGGTLRFYYSRSDDGGDWHEMLQGTGAGSQNIFIYRYLLDGTIAPVVSTVADSTSTGGTFTVTGIDLLADDRPSTQPAGAEEPSLGDGSSNPWLDQVTGKLFGDSQSTGIIHGLATSQPSVPTGYGEAFSAFYNYLHDAAPSASSTDAASDLFTAMTAVDSSSDTPLSGTGMVGAVRYGLWNPLCTSFGGVDGFFHKAVVRIEEMRSGTGVPDLHLIVNFIQAGTSLILIWLCIFKCIDWLCWSIGVDSTPFTDFFRLNFDTTNDTPEDDDLDESERETELGNV